VAEYFQGFIQKKCAGDYCKRQDIRKIIKGVQEAVFFMRRVFSYVTVFSMQSNLDAERLKAIGADETGFGCPGILSLTWK